MRNKSKKLPCQCQGCVGSLCGTKGMCRKSSREMSESSRGYNEMDYPTSNRHESRIYIKAKIIKNTANQSEKIVFKNLLQHISVIYKFREKYIIHKNLKMIYLVRPIQTGTY